MQEGLSLAQLYVVLETMREALIVVNKKGVLKFVNKSAHLLLGYTVEELAQTVFIEKVISGEAFEEFFSSSLAGTNSEKEVPVTIKSGEEKIVSFSTSPVVFGHEPMVLLSLRDITPTKKMYEESRGRLKIEQAIASVTSLLATTQEVDRAVTESLRIISELFASDRAYLVKLDYENNLAVQTHEWCAEGIPQLLQAYPTFDIHLLSTFIDILKRGEVINVENIATLGENEQELRKGLEIAGIKGFIALPVWVEGMLVGMMGFSSHRAQIHWDQELVGLLSTVAQVISASLERHTVEDRLSTVLMTVQDGITFSDEKGRFTVFNTEMEHLTGYTFAEVSSMPDFNAVIQAHPEDIPSQLGDVASYELGRRYESETVFRCKNGELKNILVSTVVIEHQRRRMFLSAYRDITLRKKIESTLENEKAEIERQVTERTEELHRALQDVQGERDTIHTIIESIADCVVVLDKNKVITLANNSAQQLLGFSADELVGTYYADKLQFKIEKNGEVASHYIEQVYTEGKVSKRHDLLLRKKDGRSMVVSCSLAPLKDAVSSVVGCVLVVRDITKEREVEQMKNDFLSMAAHQLRTPLTAIRWQSQRLLRQKMGSLNDAQVELLHEILHSGTMLLDLVSELLDVSHMEAGTLKVSPQPTDVVPIIEESIKLAKTRFGDKNQTITYTGPDIPSVITADPRLITQVFLNLIINACKYTPVNGSIRVSMFEETAKLVVEVCDTGPGVPAADADQIFERFRRGSADVVTQEEGTGLGLYLAKKIIEASHGEIGFRNNPEGGSTFWFTLPIINS